MRSAIWEGRGTNEFIASPTENGGDERRRPGDTDENKIRKINVIVCALCDKKQEQPTRALAAGDMDMLRRSSSLLALPACREGPFSRKKAVKRRQGAGGISSPGVLRAFDAWSIHHTTVNNFQTASNDGILHTHNPPARSRPHPPRC